jgi:hypothetical protein
MTNRFPHGLTAIGCMVSGAVLFAVTFFVQLASIHQTDVNAGVGYTNPVQIACYLIGAALVVFGLVYGLVALIRWSRRAD